MLTTPVGQVPKNVPVRKVVQELPILLGPDLFACLPATAQLGGKPERVAPCGKGYEIDDLSGWPVVVRWPVGQRRGGAWSEPRSGE